MKAIISSTFDDQYLFYLPITTWCWKKLGVDVICFVPDGYSNRKTNAELDKFSDAYYAAKRVVPTFRYESFKCPEHKEATYAQCSRLYAAAIDGLQEDEILITSDIDMLLFKTPPYVDDITIFGSDLTPKEQYPMCYASGKVKDWRMVMKMRDGDKIKSYQQLLDELLGDIECESFRGNYWGKDQEELFNNTCDVAICVPRARPGTQFATKRIDRDDAFFMDRLTPDIIDYHCHRPGYTDENFEKILAVIKYFYPFDDLSWMKEYQQNYKALL